MALAKSRGRPEKTIPSKHRFSHSSRKEKESAVSYTESIRRFKQSRRQADEGDSMAANYLRRDEHQPKQGPVERPVPERTELARACGKTIALVLATDFGTTPLKVSFEDENEKPVICEDPKNGETKPPALSKITWGGLKRSANKKGRIGCPLATDPALSSKQDNRYLPEPTSAGNKPARALSCSAVVRSPEGCDAFWPFTATPSYLRASMILSSAAFIEIPLSQLMAAVPLFTATAPLKNVFRIPLLIA